MRGGEGGEGKRREGGEDGGAPGAVEHSAEVKVVPVELPVGHLRRRGGGGEDSNEKEER